MPGTRDLNPIDDTQPAGVTFIAFPGSSSVEIIDPIERCWFSLIPADPITPKNVDPDRFLFPADTAIAIETHSLSLPSVHATYIRDGEGSMLAEVERFADEQFSKGRYIIEICAPIKIYLELECPFHISSDVDEMHLDFSTTSTVLIGARSRHESPAGTIVTPGEPEAIMKAVSAFGSALKTTTPERSFPTLRGHPPTVELGSSLEFPPGVEPLDTGITLRLPRDLATVYTAAPLAYYLGATIRPGKPPRVETADGFVLRLDTHRGIEAEVERVLKQTFLLDCITRVDGLYEVDLHERQVVASRVDLDFATLYDKPIAERTAAYLELPYSAIEDEVPTWGLTATVAPTPGSVEMLPFMVDDLALVRAQSQDTVSRTEIEVSAVDDFLRSGSATRSEADTGPKSQAFVHPAPTNSVEQAWVGDGMPMGASKAILEGFENRLERDPTPGNIDITVVCNDPDMNEEGEAVDQAYGSRESLPFDVTIHRTLTRSELRDVLGSQTDFLHYVGHIDREGFECVDGKLDAATLDAVCVDAFLLNACQSYDQGIQLVKSGSIGGVVTLSEVVNSGAVRIGRAFARLLNSGFPLHAALDIARDESVMGGLYCVVGDGLVTLTQSESYPALNEIETQGDNFKFKYITYPTKNYGMGSMVIPYIGANDKHFLLSNRITNLSPSKEDLSEFFTLENEPVRMDGNLYWSQEVDKGILI